jgi:hypothetical protein
VQSVKIFCCKSLAEISAREHDRGREKSCRGRKEEEAGPGEGGKREKKLTASFAIYLFDPIVKSLLEAF